MAINSTQLAEFIIRPILKRFDLYSKEAETLLVGTCAAESIIGEDQYIKQVGGPAMGIYQMEKATHDWLVDVITTKRTKYAKLITWVEDTGGFTVERLLYDLYYMTIMARVRYLVVPKRIPMDLYNIAEYWKQYYNTEAGAGTVDGFIRKFKAYTRTN